MGYIDKPHALWWRKALFQIHLWTGTIIGLFIIAICISGSVLVFEQTLLNDTPILPKSTIHGPATWGQMVHTATQAIPGSTLAYIDMRSNNRRVVPVGLDLHGQIHIVYVDSFTDHVVKQEVLQHRHWFVEFMLALHTKLASGQGGAVVIGICGALLFMMALIGIVLWWPGVRSWKRALRINWRGRWRSINFDVHRTFGFWCFVLVAMWGVTGALFIFPKPFHSVIRIFSPMPSMKQLDSEWKPGDPILPVADIIRRAQSMYPNDELAYVYMGVQHIHGEIQVYMSKQPSVPMEQLEDEVVFQPTTGAVLLNTSSRHWTAGERLSLGIYSAHFGDFGGFPLKILWALLGLVPVVLVISGYLMWWNRTLKKKWRSLAIRTSNGE